jgi:hypothetical protein
MYCSSPSRALGEASDMNELPEHFWLHMTSVVGLALLALLGMAALLAWTVSAVEDLWQGRRSRRH